MVPNIRETRTFLFLSNDPLNTMNTIIYACGERHSFHSMKTRFSTCFSHKMSLFEHVFLFTVIKNVSSDSFLLNLPSSSWDHFTSLDYFKDFCWYILKHFTICKHAHSPVCDELKSYDNIGWVSQSVFQSTYLVLATLQGSLKVQLALGCILAC